MNWYGLYRQSVTDATMPYFAEFADMGNYVPDQQVTGDWLQQRFHASVVSDIGCGDNGCAYLLSNGNVLKITTNDQEGRQAMWLSANSNPFIADIYDVHKEGDLWYIVMEKVDKASPQLAQAVQDASDYLGDRGIFSAKNAPQALIRWPGMTGPYGRQIMAYVSYLAAAPNSPFDFLDSDNVGEKNGSIKFFDIT